MPVNNQLKKQRERAWNRLMMASPSQWNSQKTIYQYYDEIYRNNQEMPEVREYQPVIVTHT